MGEALTRQAFQAPRVQVELVPTGEIVIRTRYFRVQVGDVEFSLDRIGTSFALPPTAVITESDSQF